jgi:DNA-binding XRE family transcriptional regulator
MVVINKDNDKAHENLNQKEVAKLLGVTRQTVARWMENCSTKQYNNYKIYFHANRKR